jgi:small subunit ribosomal protein S4
MGDPKKLRKQYSTPAHPWNKGDIDRAKGIRKEYGLSIRKEVLIADSFLKKYKDIAKQLIANTSKQGELEKKQMMDKLSRLGLLSTAAELDQVLSLTIQDVLNRRIQSVVYKKGLARSMKQARQFIVHRHVTLDGKDITSPSYLLSVEEESKLRFKDKSSLFDENHPERVQAVPEEAEVKAETKEEKKPVKDKKVKEDKAEPAKKEEKKEEVKAEEPKTEAKEEVKEKAEEETKEAPKTEEPAAEKAEETKAETPKEETKEEIKE